MANDYTDLANVKAHFVESTDYAGSTDYDPIFSNWITTVSRLIDKKVGRWPGFFYPTTDTVTKVFDGTGTSVLDVPEFVSISSVAVSDDGGVDSTSYDTFDSTDYWTEPYNATADALPITRIVIDTLNGGETVFWRYPKAVKVSGIPGYSLTAPEIVASATIAQCIRWFMRAKQNFQDVSSNGIASALTFKGKDLDPEIIDMLWPLILELMP